MKWQDHWARDQAWVLDWVRSSSPLPLSSLCALISISTPILLSGIPLSLSASYFSLHVLNTLLFFWLIFTIFDSPFQNPSICMSCSQ